MTIKHTCHTEAEIGMEASSRDACSSAKTRLMLYLLHETTHPKHRETEGEAGEGGRGGGGGREGYIELGKYVR